MNDKPTGEWTADDDGVLLPLYRFIGQYAKEIAEAHNAALTVGRTVLEAERKHNESTIVELEQQLAAEREGYAMALQMVHIEGKRANEAEAQLAAERSLAKVKK